MIKPLEANLKNIGKWTYRLKDKPLEQWSRRNYDTAKAYYRRRLEQADSR